MICKTTRRYNYRMYPTEEQAQIIRQFCGATRWLYNRYVDYGNEHMATKSKWKVPSYTEFLTEAPWLSECDSCALDSAKRDYAKALTAYRERPKVGKPKRKRKKNTTPSYRTNNNGHTQGRTGAIWIKKNWLKLPKIKRPIKIAKHRNLPERCRIMSVTVKEETRGVFVASVCVEFDMEIPDRIIVAPERILGLDYSSPSFYVDDQGRSPEARHEYRVSEGEIARLQAKRDARQYGSNNWWKSKNALARKHAAVASKRKDFTEQASADLARDYDVVIVEDLNLRDMAGSLTLGKATNDNGFGAFRSQLAYKLADNGGCLVKVPKFFASSKTCSDCGYKKDDLSIDDREWFCPRCGAGHDRDRNAAVNIRGLGAFWLVIAGYVTDVVDSDGVVSSCTDLFSLGEAAPDYAGIVRMIRSSKTPDGVPLQGYVLSVPHAFLSLDKKGKEQYSPSSLLVSSQAADVFVTAVREVFDGA